MTLGHRIRQLREDSHMAQKELAARLHIANSTMSQYESGERVPSDEMKIKIADLFGVSVDYLLGRPQVVSTKDIRASFGRQLKKFRKSAQMSQTELAKLLSVSQQAVAQWEKDTSTPNPETIAKIAELLGITTDSLMGLPPAPRSERGVWIPVLGDIAAGIPIEAVEDIIDYEEIDAVTASTGEHFGLRIRGDSMEPRIREGDVVIVRRQEDADTGDTVAVLVNGDSATVKRIKKEPDGGIWLIPNNPAFEAKHFSPLEIDTLPVRVLGKVIELRGKF